MKQSSAAPPSSRTTGLITVPIPVVEPLPYWMTVSLLEENGAIILPPDIDFPRQLMLIRKTMMQIARSKGHLFRGSASRLHLHTPVAINETGRNLLACLDIEILSIERSYREQRLDPYFKLFYNLYSADFRIRSKLFEDGNAQMNELVKEIRRHSNNAKFKRKIRSHERGSTKNAVVVKEHLKKIYRDYPKLLHLRLDLYYVPCWPNPRVTPVSAELMKAHREKLMRYVRRKFKRVFVGHMWTIEYGEMKGPHFHVLIHLNGQIVREGITIVRMLGQHWQNVITGGEGRYWNVNRHESAYESFGRRGIGLISHNDIQRRENLVKTALYLVKGDLFVRTVMPGLRKTFGHGVYRPRKKSNAGRKRSEPQLESAMNSIYESIGHLLVPQPLKLASASSRSTARRRTGEKL